VTRIRFILISVWKKARRHSHKTRRVEGGTTDCGAGKLLGGFHWGGLTRPCDRRVYLVNRKALAMRRSASLIVHDLRWPRATIRCRNVTFSGVVWNVASGLFFDLSCITFMLL
jgi:hypothetical protein